MDELRHAMHAAAAEPPPTRIDLDELIDGTRRRSRFQYRIGAVAGAVALTTGAVLVPMVVLPSGGLSTTGGGAPPSACPSPSFSPVPVPSESLGVVAGPTYDPSVPPASRIPTPSTEPVDSSPPPSATPVESPSAPPRTCPLAGPLSEAVRCAVDPSDPPQDGRILNVVPCGRLVPGLRDASGKAFPAEWRLTQAIIVPIKPHGYSITLVVASAQAGIAIKVQLTLVKEQPGNVRARCAALAASVHAKATDCKVQPEGDAVLVAPAGSVVVSDVRPDGTTVTVAGNSPATVEQLTTFARDTRLSALG
jgi:hypothetical protein